MTQSSIRFADLCDFEMKAASKSISLEERVARLEMAHRYARMAVAARDTESNVVAFRPDASENEDAFVIGARHVEADIASDQASFAKSVYADAHVV
jgi:hypothetical protein